METIENTSVQEDKVISVPVNEPLLTGNEKKYLAECIDTGWISSDGPFVKKFEEAFAQRALRKHAIAVSSGSVALDIAVQALEIGVGDEVIMPTFAIISCANAIVRSGAIPVLVDSDPETWNIDVSQIERKITMQTKAIMVVHTYGLPVDMDPILELAQKYDLKIIEDAAEVIGQTYKDKPCGSFGDISVVSFYPNKHVTTGEGGMILTDDENLARRSNMLRNLCFKPEQRFVHEGLGFSARMTNLQAAVGLAQLERLDSFIEKKRVIGKSYDVALQDIDIFQRPLARTDYAENIYWVYGLVLKDSVEYDAQVIMKKLAAKNIETRPFFWCMHKQPVFYKLGLFFGERYPVAEKLAQRGFYIPSGLGITQEQIELVVNAIKEIA